MAHRAFAIGPFFKAPPFCEDKNKQLRHVQDGKMDLEKLCCYFDMFGTSCGLFKHFVE